jgi:hypothetical protein
LVCRHRSDGGQSGRLALTAGLHARPSVLNLYVALARILVVWRALPKAQAARQGKARVPLKNSVSLNRRQRTYSAAPAVDHGLPVGIDFLDSILRRCAERARRNLVAVHERATGFSMRTTYVVGPAM